MTLLSEVDNNNLEGEAIIANGSGLGIAIGQLKFFPALLSSGLDVVDLRDPTNTGALLTRIDLPARPFDIAIGAGIAFVAGGTSGLQVVNYLPFDNQGQAPTITLSAPKADRDSVTPGIQALEGSLIDVKLDVNDDQQVRNVELLLLLFAVAIITLAYATVEASANGAWPANLATQVGGVLAIAVVFHLVLRWTASYADPLLLPIATLLNGLGLVMIHRLDIAQGNEPGEGMALRQLTWSALGGAIAIGVLLWLRDHRTLRRYTFLAGTAGVVLLLLPLFPFIGREINGARIWIGLGPFSFQPGEIAKIVLAVFFAGYLVRTRDVLSIAGPRVLGMQFPRGRDLGPILLMWAISLAVLFWQKDLGSALLFFGLFVAMLYVATERVGWIAIGLLLAAGGAVIAFRLFGHVQTRVLLWLHTFSPEAVAQSDQLAKGLMGMASGGLLGTGLG
ncbi:MAG: FtsW/RodA/SpoVE family cell cycle protein, partial [Candidatus Accumulibacter sp.]|nr:FtsW/RodA/SpoVE family cell cycle protein [Accumulibacter sp.]